MSLVEDAYRAAVDAMTPAQKFARMGELNLWAHWNIARIITKEQGSLPRVILKWKVALWKYGNNPTSRKLIEDHLALLQLEPHQYDGDQPLELSEIDNQISNLAVPPELTSRCSLESMCEELIEDSCDLMTSSGFQAPLGTEA